MARNNNETETKMHNVIALGTKIVGNISSDGDLRIDGEIEGEIETKGRVVLGETGKINGTIICANAEILGSFTGKLKVAETLSLRGTATFNGDITTSKIIVDANAKFNGTCSMNEDSQEASKKNKK